MREKGKMAEKEEDCGEVDGVTVGGEEEKEIIEAIEASGMDDLV